MAVIYFLLRNFIREKKRKEGKIFKGTLKASSIDGGYTTLKVGLPLSVQIIE